MVNPNHITPYGEIDDLEKELANDLVWNKREDALERFIAHFEAKGATDEGDAGKADPTEGMTPERGPALAHPPPQEGGRGGLDRPVGREDRRRADPQRRAPAGDEGGRRQVRRRRAHPAVRAAVGRGDEEGRRPARELPRAHRRLHQGQGDPRHRVRRRARHRQEPREHHPHEQRLHRDRPRQAGAGADDHRRGRRARRRRDRPLSRCSSPTSKQMPLACRSSASRATPTPCCSVAPRSTARSSTARST